MTACRLLALIRIGKRRALLPAGFREGNQAGNVRFKSRDSSGGNPNAKIAVLESIIASNTLSSTVITDELRTEAVLLL